MSEDAIGEISPREAWEALRTNPDAVLLDVRSKMEYDYVGHVPGSVFVALKEPPDWEEDGQFADRALEQLQRHRPGKDPRELNVMTLCRSGARSLTAAERLKEMGFREVLNVAEGFEGDRNEQGHRNSINGWRFHGLPWEQS